MLIPPFIEEVYCRFGVRRQPRLPQVVKLVNRNFVGFDKKNYLRTELIKLLKVAQINEVRPLLIRYLLGIAGKSNA